MFTRERISHFELFDRKAQQVISKLKERLREGYAVDFQVGIVRSAINLTFTIGFKDLMSRFTLDSATEFLFGHNVQSLSAGLPYPHNAPYVTETRTPEGDAANAFARAFAEAQEVISRRERYGWVWPLMEMWKDQCYEPMQVVNSYIEPIVKEALAKKQKGMITQEKTGEGADDETLLDHLVRVTSGKHIWSWQSVSCPSFNA